MQALNLTFSGLCGSKHIKKDKNVPQNARHERSGRGVSSPTNKPVPIDDEKAFDEFIRGVQRQTSQLQEQNRRDMKVCKKELKKLKTQSDRIGEILAPKMDKDEEAQLEKELAELAQQ